MGRGRPEGSLGLTYAVHACAGIFHDFHASCTICVVDGTLLMMQNLWILSCWYLKSYKVCHISSVLID